MKSLARFLATAGYVGYAPLAPGTAGSLVALPIMWFGFSRWSMPAAILAGLVILGIAVWSANRQTSEEHKDPQHVVIDEVAGQIIALLFVPLTIYTALSGFILFRVFDIYKPFPARQSEKLPGGWGIVMDDVVAGIYANLVLRMAINFSNTLFTGG